MLKQKLSQKLLQKLSPQQIQMIKLLEVPGMELEQRIKKELEENPALEEEKEEEANDQEEIRDEGNEQDNTDDEFSLEDYMNEEDVPFYKLSSNNRSADDEHKDIPFSGGSTFHEFLESQLGLRKLNEKQQKEAEYILGNLDEAGYLRRELESLVDDLAFSENMETSVEELEQTLDIIHDFDPPGVGARSLQECLILQLKNKKMNGDSELAYKIISEQFEEFTKKHYDKILKKQDIDEEELKSALAEILKLNPKPGSTFSDQAAKTFHHVIPDFILELRDGELQLSLNGRNVPELRISKAYSDMLRTYSEDKENKDKKDAATFVKQKLDAAKWFIDAIKQRQNTMMSTMQAIIDYQREYFEEGDETKLRPMILKDIAEKTGYDISTISRVANSKYIQTHFGILPLKSFFSEGLQTESGEEVSSREIKKILTDFISGEDKKKPLTDEKLAKILQEKGYHIARRTVAKYREQLNIPVARLRKEL